MTTGARRWAPWVTLALVLVVALAIGARDHSGTPSVQQRVRHVASGLRCPTCRSLSAQESDAPAARNMRAEIARRVRAGQTDAEVRAYFVSVFGADILLAPEGRGVAALVWALPVALFVVAVAGLALAFHRWRPSRRTASNDDRSLVDDALRS